MASARHLQARAVWVLAPLAAATVYLPIAGAALAPLLLLATLLVDLRREQWPALWQQGSFTLSLVLWLLATALWSPATPAEMVSHFWHFALLLCVPLLTVAVPGDAAWRALRVFIAASVVFAGLQVAHRWYPWPTDGVLSSMVHYVGNKSICNSVLATLGAALALDAALQPGAPPRRRAALAACAAAILGVLLVSSSARTALVTLAVLGATVAGLRMRRWWQWTLLALAVVMAVAVVSSGSSGLAARSESQLLRASNDQRLALYRETLTMIQERPVFGHGLGSWPGLWAKRSTDPEMRAFNTAHEEWLQIAQQGGLVALALMAAAVWQWLGIARAQGLRGPGSVGLLALLAWLCAATFNAAIRDASFAAPLLLILGLALAAGKRATGSERLR